jgi:stage II sporulation protein D
MLVIRPNYHRLRSCLAALAGSVTLALAGASVARASDLVIAGAGWGHGVGMSQDGALGYAERGWSYRAILAHYYTGTAIGAAPAHARVRVLIGARVRRLSLESYVRGVVSAEMSSDWPLAALEAQAVASRTYALTAHAGGSKFDVYADTRSQVYRGAAAHTPHTDAAVAATAGQIVTYAGRPAITYFFASSGGRTENVETAFPGSLPQPWLRGVLDPYDGGAQRSWTLTISFSSAAARLGGLVRGHFQGIEVLSRGFSPRIVSAYVLGSGGRTLVSGAELAARLGLYDTWAYFSVRNGTVVSAEPDRSGRPANLGDSPQPAQPSGGASPGAGESLSAGGQDGDPAAGAAAPGPSAGTTAVAGGTPAPA